MPIDIESYYERYGPMVVRRCRRLLGDEEDAIDAAQEVFVRLTERSKDLEHRAPSSLLYTTATRVCLNRIRAASRRPEVRDADLVVAIANLSDATERVAARSMLARLFSGERASTHTIAIMHLLDGHTLQETADAVGMSVSGVRRRLRGLRAKLRALDPSPKGDGVSYV